MMQTKIRPVWYTSIVLIAIGAAVLAVAYFGADKARANPASFTTAQSTSCGSITASTSVNYIAAGMATTTYTFDTGCASAGSMDEAAFLANFTGSSTSAVLGIAFEYSQDGSTWYFDDTNTSATSTLTENITASRTYSWTYSAVKQGGVSGTQATSTRVISVPTPTRYVRAILNLSGANGAVWGEFVGKRQNP